MKKKKFFYGWVIVFSCLLLSAASTGILSSLGALFVEPVTSELQLGRAEYMMYTTFATVASMLSMPLVGWLYKKFPIKILLLAGASSGAAAMFVFSISSRLWEFYAGGVLGGIGISMLGGMPIAVLLTNWFDEKRGLMTGIAFTGSALISSLFSPAVTSVIASWGWRRAYVVLGAAILLLTVPNAVFLIRLHPSDCGTVPYGSHGSSTQKEAGEKDGFTQGQALKMGSFWVFLFALFLIGLVTMGTQQHLVAYWTHCRADAQAAATAYAIAMAVSTFAKIGVGGIFDRVSVTRASILCGSLVCVNMVMLYLCQTGVLVYIPAVLFGITTSLQVMASTYLTGKLFGEKDYSSLFGVASTALMLGAAVGVPLGAFIFDQTGKYDLVWKLFGVLSIILTIALVTANFLSHAYTAKQVRTDRSTLSMCSADIEHGGRID